MNVTIIKTKTGETINFTTQQYEIGTYCIINNDPSQQFGVNTNEIKFHKSLHRNAKKNGDTIVNTTVN